MKRIIKYRVWEPQYKIMHPVTFIDFNTMELDHLGNANEPKSWEHFEIMQFSGLYDKNGKEIYEGDIVKCKDSLWAVEFDDKWGYVCYDKKHIALIYPWYDNLEVIGNIYENTELL